MKDALPFPVAADDLMLDDDELMEMAAQPADNGPAASALLSMPDDDELMELALCSQEQEAPLGGDEDEDEDEDADLLALADFGEEEEEDVQPGLQARAQAQAQAGSDADEAEDEDAELLKLAEHEPAHENACAAAEAPAAEALAGPAAVIGDEGQPSAAGLAEDDEDDALLELAMRGSQE